MMQLRILATLIRDEIERIREPSDVRIEVNAQARGCITITRVDGLIDTREADVEEAARIHSAFLDIATPVKWWQLRSLLYGVKPDGSRIRRVYEIIKPMGVP